jgi:hypothetical protein
MIEKSTRGGSTRRRLLGAALMIVGGLAVLYAPWHLDAVSDSSGPFGSESRLDLIYWPPGWYWVHLPMLIIGVVFVVTGLILVSTRPEPRKWRGDLRSFVVFGRSGEAQAILRRMTALAAMAIEVVRSGPGVCRSAVTER